MHTQDQDHKDRLVQISDEVKIIQAQADAERRDLTVEEDREINGLFNEFRSVEIEMAMAGPGRVTEPQMPMSQPGLYTSRTQSEIVASQRTPYAGRKMADIFGKARVSDAGKFRSMGEFFQCVANGTSHPGLIRNATMTEGTGADGGFTVAPAYLTAIFDESLESEIIRPRARVYPMASSELNIASIDYSNHSSNIGGLDGNWISENSTETAQKAAYRQLTLRTKKLAIYTEASSEVVADGMSFERTLRDAMSQSLGFSLDQSFIRGVGGAEPTGILNCAATISVARESGQSADTLIFENLVNMFSRLHPGLIKGGIWLINPELVPQLLTLSFPGSTDAPLFIPNMNAGEETPGTIFGLPLFYSEKCSAIGDQGDIILVNPSMYAIGMRLDAAFDRSIAPGFMRDVESFRLITRVDGQPLMNAAVTPRYGTNTLSFAVTLDDRA